MKETSDIVEVHFGEVWMQLIQQRLIDLRQFWWHILVAGGVRLSAGVALEALSSYTFTYDT